MKGNEPQLYEVSKDGRLRISPHHGQWRAWQSERRIVAVLAGTQSGKTVFGPLWLYREIQRRGAGDYMVVTPTFQILGKKALPSFRALFESRLGLGRYRASPVRYFEFSAEGCRKAFGDSWDGTPTQVFFGHAMDPDSLESATAKAAWLDEAGQKKFRRASWEAIMRRLSIYEGRVLITTTPYDLGWLKQVIYDRWQAGDPTIDVINFKSIGNPAFPRAEYERARRELPGWRFRMFYQGLFERPAGLIYDCFDEERHKVPRFALPADWKRYMGIDFGPIHTAALFYAEEPGTGRLYLYREYLAGKKTIKEHARDLLAGEPMVPLAVGGAGSESQWRMEFRSAGLPVLEPPVREVEVGINRVYAAHKAGQIIVFADLGGYLDEKMGYTRAVDENGEPTEVIEDKSSFHFMDAERYIVGYVKRPVSVKVASEAPVAGAARHLRPGSVRGRL